MPHQRSIVLLLALVGVVACSTADPTPESSGTESPQPPTATETTVNAMEAEMPDQRQSGPRIEEVINAARRDLAERRSVLDEDIDLVNAQRVTWGDGSLGCPEPGMMYTQALVPGFFIHLRSGDDEFFYHAGRDGRPMYCPADRSKPPVYTEDLD